MVWSVIKLVIKYLLRNFLRGFKCFPKAKVHKLLSAEWYITPSNYTHEYWFQESYQYWMLFSKLGKIYRQEECEQGQVALRFFEKKKSIQKILNKKSGVIFVLEFGFVLIASITLYNQMSQRRSKSIKRLT